MQPTAILILAAAWLIVACGGSPPAGLMFEASDSPETAADAAATPGTTQPPSTIADLRELVETPTSGLPDTFPVDILPPDLISSEYIRAGSGEIVELESSSSYEEIVEFYIELIGDPAFTSTEDGVARTFWLHVPGGSLGERLQTTIGVFDMNPVLVRVTGLF